MPALRTVFLGSFAWPSFTFLYETFFVTFDLRVMEIVSRQDLRPFSMPQRYGLHIPFDSETRQAIFHTSSAIECVHFSVEPENPVRKLWSIPLPAPDTKLSCRLGPRFVACYDGVVVCVRDSSTGKEEFSVTLDPGTHAIAAYDRDSFVVAVLADSAVHLHLLDCRIHLLIPVISWNAGPNSIAGLTVADSLVFFTGAPGVVAVASLEPSPAVKAFAFPRYYILHHCEDMDLLFVGKGGVFRHRFSAEEFPSAGADAPPLE